MAIHVAAVAAYGVIHTSWMWAVRTLLYPLFHMGPFDYGAMPLRYLMELPFQAIGYACLAVCIILVDQMEARRRQQLQSARLESRLAAAQVQVLRRQLQPHFLFNALNTISSTLYDDPEAADEMIDRLATLLRYSLRTAHTDEVPLRDELDTVEAYVAIMSARFGDRLNIEQHIDPELHDAKVPSMILQPLVENAIRHGGVESDGQAVIDIRAYLIGQGSEDERLVLEVEDDGLGVRDDTDPLSTGVGLSTTAERLALLYGGRQSMTAENSSTGFLVRLQLPRQEMSHSDD